VKILLADDHHLVRAGIRSLLEKIEGVEVVGETGDGREALELIDKLRPDIALLDITMPSLNGVEVAARAGKTGARTRIVILSMHADGGYVGQALRAGVAGYLLKDAVATELRLALAAVARGDTYLSPAISTKVVEGFLRAEEQEPDPLAILTKRQRDILQLIAEGRSTKEIASELNISAKTVESHRTLLMERLDIHDIPGLVRFAIRAGLVSA